MPFVSAAGTLWSARPELMGAFHFESPEQEAGSSPALNLPGGTQMCHMHTGSLTLAVISLTVP